ncbi:MAG: helix-turn-helix domain-containing protein [Gammaproteobacteria bacterium]|nr:helix-turn-helix domain-containing protein [Gammaproteobacteria bacterium]
MNCGLPPRASGRASSRSRRRHESIEAMPLTIPNVVVNKVINKDMTPIRAWREHLGLTQTEVARRLGVSQSAYAQQEAKEPVRKATCEKIAQTLGIAPEQLAV